jgi:ATP-dependent DNA helicase PIF1
MTKIPDPSNGLCNGTRLIILRLSPNAIEAVIVTGSHIGLNVFLPKLPLMSAEDATIPFALRRFQFPVRHAFALTINKSQGQTIPNVGIFLREPCFSHGQLHVEFSRVKSRQNIKVMVGGGSIDNGDVNTTTTTTTTRRNKKNIYTVNVVYKELLLPSE